MNQGMQLWDYIVFMLYFAVVAAIGYSIYRKRAKTASTTDYFLAEGSLTWWAIGASLIASNISAEQFIGMSGSGFAMGLAIASYEWMAALTLLVVAVFFLPIYLKNKIYTMPQFLSDRFDGRVSTVMAVFWLLVYVFVNLSSILYLGALTLERMVGLNFMVCVIGLAVFAIVITLGGMRVIGYTDVFQVLVLIIGGLITAYLALDLVAQNFGTSGFFAGLSILHKEAPGHFDMILSPDNKFYSELPGLTVLVGGMWIANLSYWGSNQYITQRALGAKDLDTAQKGLLFAGFLKLMMPLIVVIPGIAAYVLHNVDPAFKASMTVGGIVKPDSAYSTLLDLLPTGLKGIAFAALVAAIVASLAGKANSIATIFTLDIFKKFMDKDASEDKLVQIGQVSILASFIIAIMVAPALTSLDQGFQYIQEYTGFITPGVCAIFLLGLFWKKATPTAALTAALLTIPLSAIMKSLTPMVPFLDRMGYVFLILVALMVFISYLKPESSKKEIVVDQGLFETSFGFRIGALLIMGVLAALYIAYW
ncbi:MAG: sodium/sugar symporter [Bacteroidetes Order II. Incertae sedis bacterium]|nr:sodium/sugar symporter [Bacteroidetes Order II. bacterium]